MQPSQFEIQREVENLRDIRRRSTAGGPGALVLDPDLPNQSALGAAQLNYWDPSQTPSSSSSSAEESGSSADDHDDGSDGGDPSSLFWVPARLHPEIAPAEFRAFIKEHARAPGDGSSSLDRSFSTSSGGLGRKKSMLNREYKPAMNDGVEDEGQVLPLRRNRTSYYNVGPQLSISDLQKLDELAEEASQSDDPSKLRSVLRRSLSLNMSPSVIDQMDMPDLGDEADAPIIVPKPGQILRRSARTKIRKPGQTGEGAHRFQTTRSRRISNSRSDPASMHTDQEPQLSDPDPGLALGFNGSAGTIIETTRPESFSAEAFIYDAYAVDEPVEMLVSRPPPDERSPSPPSIIEFESQHPSLVQPHNIPIPPTPNLHHPQPRNHLAPTHEPRPPSRTPSPDASSVTLVEVPQRSPEAFHSVPTPSPPLLHDRKEKEKGKKGGFFGWGGEKGKKGPKEKEKDSSFLGSLFGSSKKKQEEYTGTGLGSGSGRETAAALLGASKSKSRAASPTPQAGGPYARYPIHVERAIYRLSHIKLANPRRPLYEQVLISNLMFWYLGVINNKGQTNGTGQNQNQAKESQQQQQGTGQHPQGVGQDPNSNLEKERKEQEEREKAEKERIEAENEREKEREREREREELQAQQQQQAQRREQKRGPLTKPAPGPPGQRKAEMPVRGPQYEMQHRVMEQEYGGYDPRSQSQNRSGPMPYNPTPQLIQSQPQMTNNMMYYTPGNSPGPNSPSQRPSSPQLPPGAMPPMNPEQAPWKTQGGPRRSMSPPQVSYGQNPMMEKAVVGRAPSRSLSASATQQQMVGNPGFQHQPNGKLRKGTSVHAIMNPAQRGDEDSPMAMWQQQQRRK